MRRRRKAFKSEAISYAEDILIEALRTGYADPLLLVECVHYAAEPEVIAFTRAFAALNEPARLSVMKTVGTLSAETQKRSDPKPSVH